MVDYLTDKNGEPIDIRKLTPFLPHYNVTQGSCSDGTYIYMVFERKESPIGPRRCKIVKLAIDVTNDLRVVKVSRELDIGHGNDLTYKDGMLYVTHSIGSFSIHLVDAEELTSKGEIEVTIPEGLRRKRIKAFNGIAKYGAGFILRVIGGSGILITDSGFHGVRYYRTKKLYRISQGMDQKGNMTYRAYSIGQSVNRNYLAVFDDKGVMVRRQRIDVRGEMESVFFVNEDLYGTVYRKKLDEKGRMRFEAYIFKIEL